MPHSRLAEVQRARLLSAALEAIGEHGYCAFTVGQVIERAKVSRKTFYEVFADRDECFDMLFDRGVSELERRLARVYSERRGWREGIRAALAEALAFIEEQPALARLCVVDSLAASPRIAQRRQRLLEQLCAVVERGRAERGGGRREPPEVAGEGAVGAVLTVLHTRLLQRDRNGYMELAGQLTSMLVLPYLGAAAAQRELQRPPPDRTRTMRGQPGSDGAVNGDRNNDGDDGALEVPMRLTYRTVRVLKAIADQRGASNRQVADAAGISDQGQMSKLLARLERLRLVENRRDGQPAGAPNCWQLTAQGARIERSTRGP